MKTHRLRVGLDVDDILYDCNAYALERLNRDLALDPPLSIYDIRGWGNTHTVADQRLRYFSDPDFVTSQPFLPGAQSFVRKLSRLAEVFFITAVPPACMSARALRLARDFPEIPEQNIIIGNRKDMVKLDVLLDDGAHNITRTPATYPVLFRKPWNVQLSGLLSVNSYDDFLHLVRMLKNAANEKDPDLSEGGVLCLVGPTGTEKNGVASHLAARFGFEKPLTATTRPRRDAEEGSYRFLTEEEFIEKKDRGDFLETTVYSGYHFGTEASEIDSIVDRCGVAVLPIDICGALTLKNRYRSRAMLVFLKRDRYGVIKTIVGRQLSPDDMTCRILSLDHEYRNEELCDLTVVTEGNAEETARAIAEAVGVTAL